VNWHNMEKVVKIVPMKDAGNDIDYWMSKTPEERIAAIEVYRQRYMKMTGYVRQGFPRVCRIIRKD